jgi:hypothetical protein
MMRHTIVALLVWTAAVVLLVLDMQRVDDGMPPAWVGCVTRCERTEPWDRGQGCIDMECNPLLPPQFEENDQ